MSWYDDFLSEREPVQWTPPEGFPAGLVARGMFVQTDRHGEPVPNGLEVVLAEADRPPTKADIRDAWKKRRAGRASPVLLVVCVHQGEDIRIWLCGPAGEHPVVYQDVELSRAERLADAALDEPSYHAAIRLLLANLPELDSRMAGLRNIGLLATHELHAGVPGRADWAEATERAKPLLDRGLRDRQLVEALGFTIEDRSSDDTSHVRLLKVGNTRRAVAVFCTEDEEFDAPSNRFPSTSPVSQALAEADRLRRTGEPQLDWVLITRGPEIRLYAARPNIGVGRTGRAETFVEANLVLLPPEKAGYLHLLFSSEALRPKGTIEEILEDSADFAAELATELRDRVYYRAVPALAQAVADRLGHAPSDHELRQAYEQVLLILFRLLFLAYGEDKDLLPYRSNEEYAEQSLSALARDRTAALREGQDTLGRYSNDLWERVIGLWQAVDQGNSAWGVPAYNGGLFSSDPEVSRMGAVIADMRPLSDAEFAPALDAILLAEGAEGLGPVDFRSLSVREFGTIYEGLLESTLAIAQDDLTVKKVKNLVQYVPAKAGDDVTVEAGEVYLYNRSGARKATGSYFTKPFAVEHLLDVALEPALDSHIALLEQLYAADDTAALEKAFFDFRCADIAMGSGHFLVAAVDRIEARLSSFLSQHSVPAVSNELERLRRTALDALGDLGHGMQIETSSLLRRQVARHCVYGVDLQNVAVELARLAIWVHTFVPGLPLSFLDHNLVCGNSLTGVSSLEEVMAAVDPKADPDVPSLFRQQMEEQLQEAGDKLLRLATTSDATKRELEDARQAHDEALAAVAPVMDLFNLVSASHAGVKRLPDPTQFDEAAIGQEHQQPEVQEAMERLLPLHFPAAFPEVFLRERPGFDCLLGNPPWETVVANEKEWWGRHLPGIRGLPVGEMNAAVTSMRATRLDLEEEFQQALKDAEYLRTVLRTTYSDLGVGDTDLYKAFSWRNWQLIRGGGQAAGGTAGIVLPRTVLQSKGSEHWRSTVLAEGTFKDVTTLLNTGGWVFDDVHRQYMVALLGLQKSSDPERTLCFSGHYSSQKNFEARNRSLEPVPLAEFSSWSDNNIFPQVSDHPGAMRLFRKLKAHPRFDEFELSSLARGHGVTGSRGHGVTGSRGHGVTRPDPGASDHIENSILQTTKTSLSSTARIPLCWRTTPHSRQTPIHPRQQSVRDDLRRDYLACLQGCLIQSLAARHRQLLRLSGCREHHLSPARETQETT